MTRRDYVLVAKVIRSLRPHQGKSSPVTLEVYGKVVDAFVTEFKADKPTFNAEAFRKECSK